jgi:hypothetical protein
MKEMETLKDIHGSGNGVRFILVRETTVLQAQLVQQRQLKTAYSLTLNSALMYVAHGQHVHCIGFATKEVENT